MCICVVVVVVVVVVCTMSYASCYYTNVLLVDYSSTCYVSCVCFVCYIYIYIYMHIAYIHI